MEHTLTEAMATLFTLQRWNFLPRIDTWVEAENVCYIAHIGYAIGCETHVKDASMEKFFARTLLKSFNKHFLSDIPVTTRAELKTRGGDLWSKIVDGTAMETSKLFPRTISAFVYGYLTHSGHYTDKRGSDDRVEKLVKYAQWRAALDECMINQSVYQYPVYAEVIGDLKSKLATLPPEFDACFNRHEPYFQRVRTLKYLRRWNRINRSIESSVMSHTFLVAVLVLLFSEISKKEASDHNDTIDYFQLTAVRRALFHDVPEALTGDLITPVKQTIARYDSEALNIAEKALQDRLLAAAPEGVRQEIENNSLLDEIREGAPFSVDSLVKACDRLALVLECAFERRSAGMVGEMRKAYFSYLQDLQNSEWPGVRDFSTRLVLDLPRD